MQRRARNRKDAPKFCLTKFTTLATLTAITTTAAAHSGSDSEWVGLDGGLWNIAINWNPMVIPNGAFDVVIDNATTATMNINVSLDSLSIGSTSGLVMQQTRQLTIAGGLLHNDGEITMNDAGFNDARLVFSADGNIAGTGEIVINGNNSGDRIETQNGSILIQEIGHTIRGEGAVTANMINNGLILADDAAGGLFELRTEDKTNNGIIQASNDGIMRIGDITIDNTNGLIVADGGNVQLSNLATIIGGQLTSIGSSEITGIGNATLRDVELTGGSLYSIDDFRTLHIEGSLLNNGTILINNAGFNDADLIFDNSGPMALDGIGEILLNGNNAGDEIDTEIGTTIFHNPPHRIRGAGAVTASILNNSIITSDIASSGHDVLELRGVQKTNNNLLTTSNDAVLRLTDDVFILNNNGRIVANDGDVQCQFGIIQGGELESLGDSEILATGNFTLRDVTITPGTLYSMNAGRTTTIEGSLLNNGIVLVNNVGTDDANIVFDNAGGIALGGTGELLLNGNNTGDKIETTAGTTIFHNPPHLIRGAGAFEASVINNSEIAAEISGTGHDVLELVGEQKNNNALITTRNGSRLRIADNVHIANSNAEIIAANGNVECESGSIEGGELESLPGSIFDAIGTNFTLRNLTLRAGTLYQIRQGRSTILQGAIENNGMILVNDAGFNDATLVIGQSTTLSGSGELFINGNNNGDQLIINAGQTLTNDSGHTIRFRDGLLKGDFVNSGQLIVDEQLTVQDSDGNLTALDLPASVLAGNGTINATEVNNNGAVTPGNSPGELTINGNYNQGSAGTLDIEIGGFKQGEFDVLNVDGDVSLGGILRIRSFGGFAITPGDSFTILTADTVSGTFDHVIAVGSLDFTVAYNADSVVITAFEVTTDDFEVFDGVPLSGSLDDLKEADDVRLRMRSEFGFLSSEPNVAELRVGYTASDMPSELDVTFEGRVNNPDARVRVRLRNWNTGSFATIADFNLASSNVDERVIIENTPAADFVRTGDGRIEVSIRQTVIATFSLSGFITGFDEVTVRGGG